MRLFCVLLLVAAILPGVAFGRESGPRQDAYETLVLQQFHDAIDGYVALHRDVWRRVPPLEVSPDARRIRRATEALASGIRAARPSAREGDIFATDVCAVLRWRILRTLEDSGYDPAEVLAGMTDEDVPVGTEPQVVNERFSWVPPSFMLPSLLAALPPLPDELEYRFVDRDLILLDVNANLVIDVLRNAFPATGATPEEDSTR